MVRCDNCNEEHDHAELVDDESCPTCGTQLMFSVGPSRGSAAELLLEERLAAETQTERDVYRTLLHLLACNLLADQDVSAFLYFGETTNNLNYVLEDALEATGSIKDDTYLQCPNCEETISARAQWFDEPHENSITPIHALR